MTPKYNRREFAHLSLASVAAAGAGVLTPSLRAQSSGGKPDSRFAGVQIGINVPYSYGDNKMPGDEVLQRTVSLGISAVELRTQPVETFMGAPAAFGKDRTEKLQEWRASAPLARAKDFRRQWEDAGVKIHVLKIDDFFKMDDAGVDYVFALAKTLGAKFVSSEISKSQDDLKRIGAFADKHKMMVGYHGHTAVTPEMWEAAFSYAKYNGANVDLGHFVAGNNTSPIPFIKEYHERITHVHIKDKKMHLGKNYPLGEGDTPVAETLRLIRDNHWKIDGVIEFEYPVPAGSTRMAEIARMVQYCRNAVTTA